MKRTVWLWQLIGFALTVLLGTLLHFLYEWMGEALWLAPFSGVNESTWEHMKLLFWPLLLFAAVQSFFFRDREAFFSVKLRGILLGLVSIPLIFYTYNGVIGRSPDWVNIAIFFLAAGLAFFYEAVLFYQRATPWPRPRLAVAVLCLIAVLFVLFTFFPPSIELFRDPVTGNFGV